MLAIHGNVHLIDLDQTLYLFKRALNLLSKLFNKRGKLIVVPHWSSCNNDANFLPSSSSGPPVAVLFNQELLNNATTSRMIKQAASRQLITMSLVNSSFVTRGIQYPVPIGGNGSTRLFAKAIQQMISTMRLEEWSELEN